MEIGQQIIKINLETHGELTNDQLAQNLKDRGYGTVDNEGILKAFARDTIRRWCISLGTKKLRQYIHPTLTLKQKVNRMDWVLNEVKNPENLDSLCFIDNFNTVHLDEAWYYMRVDGRAVRMLKNADGTWSTFETVRSRSKRYINKMMFIAAVCRPHPNYASESGSNEPHSGKCYFGNFTERTYYIRGPRAGQERILNVSVDSEAYCMKMKNDIIPGIMKSMWWHHRDSGKPEAGQPIFIQQDGASPHTSAFTLRHQRYLMSNRFFHQHGFRFVIVTQPANSPDLNLCDLTIWHSNKSSLRGKRWDNKLDMESDIFQSWEDYPREKIEAGWRILYAVYRGILKANGDNTFSKHDGDRKRRRAGQPPDMNLDRAVFEAAVAERDRILNELGLEFDDDRNLQAINSEGDNENVETDAGCDDSEDEQYDSRDEE